MLKRNDENYYQNFLFKDTLGNKKIQSPYAIDENI